MTTDDVYDIFDRVGFKDARKHITNNSKFYQTAFVRPSYVKKCIFNQLNKDGNKTEMTEQPSDSLDL